MHGTVMEALSPSLRRKLDSVVRDARDVAEAGAVSALTQLAVGATEPPKHLTPEERKLRNRLRAHGRQLGDARDPKSGSQQIAHLVSECAYEHWHRMLFARFLAENGLLMHPDGVAVTLAECQEMAAAEPNATGWDVAGRYASRMLPQIFRPQAPELAVHMPPEHQRRLEQLLESLAAEIFTAADALGWVYQYWQSKVKEEINAGEVKVGADELPAVTQLFTEDYMVLFLLHNTLGAWWAAKLLASRPDLARTAQSEQELRVACSVGRTRWEYLRFVRNDNAEWRPAAGGFQGWPRSARNIRVLDPSMGSGHFLAFALPILTDLRMSEEGLDQVTAISSVLKDNLFGLEIDPRCTQIAAFNLAFTAWRAIGYRPLPPVNLACSGLRPNAPRQEWRRLAEGDERATQALERLYDLFEEAPVLGSLIDPDSISDDLFTPGLQTLTALLAAAIGEDSSGEGSGGGELCVYAQGLASAARLLSEQFTLVVTNVPYLVSGKQCSTLRAHLERAYPDAAYDLATAFLQRIAGLVAPGGAHGTVTPQNWLFLASYAAFRREMLESQYVPLFARVGSGATATASWDVIRALCVWIRETATGDAAIEGVDAPAPDEEGRAEALRASTVLHSSVAQMRASPDSRITPGFRTGGTPLKTFAASYQGVKTGDDGRLRRYFWEVPEVGVRWRPLHSTTDATRPFAGLDAIVDWVDDGALMARRQGVSAWGRVGVAASQMRHLPCTLFLGDIFDSNVSAIVPKDPELVPALWAFCSSPEFNIEVRKVDQSLAVTNGALGLIPFDRERWTKEAQLKFPHGLPQPSSTDCTQWLFDGLVPTASDPLQVAVARLVGYNWPRRANVPSSTYGLLGPDGLEHLVDADGIVTLPPLQKQEAAAVRLQHILVHAFGAAWTTSTLDALLEQAGGRGRSLEEWLRNTFFERHCQVFRHRPFVWHIWDGCKRDGFSALVNYHKLDRKLLESLTYAYLGEWLRRQQDDAARNREGAAERLAAAKGLQQRLEAILAGESPLDVFARWKAAKEQPLGWEPDLNDGVRINIRPFLTVPDVGLRGAGVLRCKPNVNWNKDRGKDPAGSPWYAVFRGDRINDHHVTLGEKKEARALQRKAR